MAIVKKSLGGLPVDEESIVVHSNREMIPLLKEVRSEVNRISGNPVEITDPSYLVTAADRVLVFTTGAQTTTLLAAADMKENWLTFKVLGGTSLVISAQAGEFIDGAASVSLTSDKDSITLYSDGTKYVEMSGLGTASSVTTNQESLTAETISTDVTLDDTLDNLPVSNPSVRFHLNGLLQRQGVGFDYTVSGQAITWLAGTGTAVNMVPADGILVVYES